jgi:uncharacterized protein YndB with AHSA1/START domain
MADRIEKNIELAASVSRVWRALTDHREFCTWFHAELDGPFVRGKTVRGHSTYPGHEDAKFEIVVQKMEPDLSFSFTWPAYADGSSEAPHTLVEFTLAPSRKGTLLRVVESGFDKLPIGRRLEVFRENDAGWSVQVNNIAEYLAHAS